jgi:SAM-dependent methyltransferase
MALLTRVACNLNAYFLFYNLTEQTSTTSDCVPEVAVILCRLPILPLPHLAEIAETCSLISSTEPYRVPMRDQTNLERRFGATPVGWIGEACHLDPSVLARILTPQLLGASPEDRVAHTLRVYERSAQHNPNRESFDTVPKSLLTFMNLTPNHGTVLDLGCGAHARDSIFLAESDGAWRDTHVSKTIEAHGGYAIPTETTKRFRVIAVENARVVWEIASQVIAQHPWSSPPLCASPLLPIPVLRMDMHNLNLFPNEHFDGVWAHRSLLSHTPHEWVRTAIQGIARILRPGGIFSVTYTPSDQNSHQVTEILRPFGDHDLISITRHEQVFVETVAYYAGLEICHLEHTDTERPDPITGAKSYLTQCFKKT